MQGHTCIVARQRVTVVRVLPVGGELKNEHDCAEDHGTQQDLDRRVILLGLDQQYSHLDEVWWGNVGWSLRGRWMTVS